MHQIFISLLSDSLFILFSFTFPLYLFSVIYAVSMRTFATTFRHMCSCCSPFWSFGRSSSFHRRSTLRSSTSRRKSNITVRSSIWSRSESIPEIMRPVVPLYKMPATGLCNEEKSSSPIHNRTLLIRSYTSTNYMGMETATNGNSKLVIGYQNGSMVADYSEKNISRLSSSTNYIGAKLCNRIFKTQRVVEI